MKRLLSLSLLGLILISCGGKLQNFSSSPQEEVNYNPIERSYLVFDPYSTKAEQPVGIPFPNDLLFSSTGGYLKVDLSKIEDPEERALFEAINRLNLKGFSPNTPIFIPLSSDRDLDLSSLKGRYYLIDLTLLKELSTKGTPSELFSLIDHSVRLYPLQDGNYLKFYPVKPLEAGHQYLFVLLSGIKDSEGKELLPSQVYNELESTTPLSDDSLEKVREFYQSKIYGELFPLLTQLSGVKFDRDTVLEAFTFTTADKTLSLSDFKSIEDFLSGESSKLEVSGLSYLAVQSEVNNLNLVASQVAPLLKELAISESLREGRPVFPAVSVRKLSDFLKVASQVSAGLLDPKVVNWGDYLNFIPLLIGNGSYYDGKLFVFQHGLGSSKEKALNLEEVVKIPFVAIDLPYHGDYTKLTLSDQFECGEGKCFLTGNVVSDRLNIYQAQFNLLVLSNLLKLGTYDLDGDGAPDAPSEVDFVGVSMGSITGEVAYSVGSSFSKAAFSVGGGNLVSIIDSARNELIEGLLSQTGLKKNTNGYVFTLGIFQTILDPADPSYYPLSPQKSEKSLFQSACCDTVVPFVSNLSFAYSLFGVGAKPVVLDAVEEFQEPPSSSGWYQFGDPEHWVIHSFLTGWNLESYPEVAPHTNEDYLKEATLGAQKQVYLFLSGK
ncbi:hypothetical protein [Thermovibrio sp.]